MKIYGHRQFKNEVHKLERLIEKGGTSGKDCLFSQSLT
jgi:hypothetical protein